VSDTVRKEQRTQFERQEDGTVFAFRYTGVLCYVYYSVCGLLQSKVVRNIVVRFGGFRF
jgi:ribonuclease HIII